ncbi:MAG: hypothetical protein F6K19_22555 [Cyanothece sp. SIO1E1]|nr:hypothetical protein [Cyanothece sp. SIO1E1]
MTTGILQRLPDLSTLQQTGTAATRDLGSLLGSFRALETGESNSPITRVTQVLGELGGKLDIDVSGLAEQLPQTMNVVKNALPADTLTYVEAIADAYTTAQNFLQESAVAQQVQAGSSLQATALAVIEDGLSLFEGRLSELSGNLLPTDDLNQVSAVFTQIDQFQADFPSHQDQLLPFLTQNLIGVAPDLLQAPLDQLDTVYSLLAPLTPAALTTRLGAAQSAIATSLSELLPNIQSFDPTQSESYTQLQTQLTGLESAINTQTQALTALYGEIETVVSEYDGAAVLTTYSGLLEAITLDPIFSTDEVISRIVAVLEDLQARLYMTFGAEDITTRVEALSRIIRDTFVESGLGQIRQTLRGYLEQIQAAIASVPTESIQATVTGMLARVRQELENLGITDIEAQIQQAFTDVETFITENLDATLTNDVRTALAQVLSEVRSLPVADLIQELTRVIAEFSSLIQEFKTALQGYMEDFRQFVAQLDQLSFRPISDEVIDEIEALKTKLAAINPNALSDVEKFAIKAALAVLEDLDLEVTIVAELNVGFGAAQDQVKSLLGEITTLLDRLRNQVLEFSPDVVLQPVYDLLDQAVGQVSRLNGTLLMRPLYQLCDTLVQQLEAIAPGRLLDPLQAPYDQMLQVVNRLDPAQWVAPLYDLYEQIDRLINSIDITPLMDELDQRQKQLFADARTAILAALDELTLPEPLNQFWSAIRTVLTGMTDAIFGDPDTELQQLSLDLRSQFNVSSLFQPLDQVFDRLVGMVESLPSDALIAAMNTIRQVLGVGLEALDPARILNRLRQGQGQLADIAPALQLGAVFKLPQLKLQFQARAAAAPGEHASAIAAVAAQFDAIATLVDTTQANSPVNLLLQSHQRLMDQLRQQINGLNWAAAETAYANLKGNLDRLLPAFLRQPTPLTLNDISAGLAALRPSAQAGRIDQAIDRFLQQLAPLEAALTPAVNGFFATLRDTIMLINPLSLKDAIEDIYDTIRAKVRILDPAALETAIRTDVLEPLTAPLDAINPANLKLRLDDLFNGVLATLSNSVKTLLDDVTEVVDDQLRAIRAEVIGLIEQVKTTIQSATQGIQEIIGEIEQLVFVELLERLNRVIDNLGISFDQEINRVVNSFTAMLAAIPISEGGASREQTISATI